MVCDTLYQPNFFPAQWLETQNCRVPQKGESGDIAGASWQPVSLFNYGLFVVLQRMAINQSADSF